MFFVSKDYGQQNMSFILVIMILIRKVIQQKKRLVHTVDGRNPAPVDR